MTRDETFFQYLGLQCHGVDCPRFCSDMVDDMVSETPLVEEGFWPAQVGNEACEGQFGALDNLLAAPHQGGIAWTCHLITSIQHHKYITWWVQDNQFNWIRHWTRACRVHPDAGEVAVEVPRDVLQ